MQSGRTKSPSINTYAISIDSLARYVEICLIRVRLWHIGHVSDDNVRYLSAIYISLSKVRYARCLSMDIEHNHGKQKQKCRCVPRLHEKACAVCVCQHQWMTRLMGVPLRSAPRDARYTGGPWIARQWSRLDRAWSRGVTSHAAKGDISYLRVQTLTIVIWQYTGLYRRYIMQLDAIEFWFRGNISFLPVSCTCYMDERADRFSLSAAPEHARAAAAGAAAGVRPRGAGGTGGRLALIGCDRERRETWVTAASVIGRWRRWPRTGGRSPWPVTCRSLSEGCEPRASITRQHHERARSPGVGIMCGDNETETTTLKNSIYSTVVFVLPEFCKSIVFNWVI